MAKEQEPSDAGETLDAPFVPNDWRSGNVETGRTASKPLKPRRTRTSSRKQPKAK